MAKSTKKSETKKAASVMEPPVEAMPQNEEIIHLEAVRRPVMEDGEQVLVEDMATGELTPQFETVNTRCPTRQIVVRLQLRGLKSNIERAALNMAKFPDMWPEVFADNNIRVREVSSFAKLFRNQKGQFARAVHNGSIPICPISNYYYMRNSQGTELDPVRLTEDEERGYREETEDGETKKIPVPITRTVTIRIEYNHLISHLMQATQAITQGTKNVFDPQWVRRITSSCSFETGDTPTHASFSPNPGLPADEIQAEFYNMRQAMFNRTADGESGYN